MSDTILTPPQELSATTQSFTAKAYAAHSATSGLAPAPIRRRELRPQEVQIEILYCGVCHSDLHQARNEWQDLMPTVYPCVPGHEIVGRIVKAGSAVKKFKEGDLAAVGCMVDSCGVCPSCRAGNEQFCDQMPTFTYNAEDKHLGGPVEAWSDPERLERQSTISPQWQSDPAGLVASFCAVGAPSGRTGGA